MLSLAIEQSNKNVIQLKIHSTYKCTLLFIINRTWVRNRIHKQ